MKTTFYSVVTLLIIIIGVSHAAKPKLLNQSNFAQKIEKGLWFVNFMSPYCSHCQMLAPHWKHLAEDLAPLRKTKNLHIAEVDCTLDGDLAEKQGVKGTPTLMLYNNGALVDRWRGTRDFETLSNYILAKSEEYHDPNFVYEDDGSDEDDEEVPPPPPPPEEEKTPVEPEIPKLKPNPDGKVVKLDGANFDQKLAESEPWFIKFFAPWCPHCKNLAPIWEEMAGKLIDQVNVASVDCTVDGDLCNRFEIRGYPTLKLFLNNNIVDYKGSRKLPDLLAFADKAANARVTPITTEEFEIYKKKEVLFIYFHDKYSPPEALRVMEGLARHFFHNIKIYSSNDPNLANQLKVYRAPSLVVLKDDIQNSYPGTQPEEFNDTEKIKAWINAERYPVVSALNSENSEEILSGEKLVVLGVFDPNNSSFPKAKATLWTVSRRYLLQVKRRGTEGNRSVVFAWLDGNKWTDYIYRVYGLTLQDLPAVLINDPVAEEYFDKAGNGKKLTLDNPEDLFDAVQDVKQNLLSGTSTIGFVEKAVKHSYQNAWNHPFITFAFIISLMVSFWYFCIWCSANDVSSERGYPKFE